MDTIGTVQTAEYHSQEASFREEAYERLRYLAVQSRSGVLVGRRGTGKSQLLETLKCDLERDGISTSIIKLAGVSAVELPYLVSAELGLGTPVKSDLLTHWVALQEYASGCQQTMQPHVFLFDQVDRAPAELATVFDRMLSLFESTFSSIFVTRPRYPDSFKSLFKSHSWLRIDLKKLSASEVSQSIARHLADEESEIQISKEALSAVQDASKGRVDQLNRLTELAILAAEAEEIRVINEEIIRSIQSELKVK